MAYTTKSFISYSGKRFCQLYDTDNVIVGFPMFYPTYYTQSMLLGNSHSTQTLKLNSIKYLYEWQSLQQRIGVLEGVDIHHRLVFGKYFMPNEINSLTQFILKKRQNGPLGQVCGDTFNKRLNRISDYLEWYAEEVSPSPNTPESQYKIDRMVKMLKKRKNKSVSRYKLRQVTAYKHLPETAECTLLSLFDALDGFDPRSSSDICWLRNVTCLNVLYDSGIRVGELLGLALCDYIPARGGFPAMLKIIRRHDSKGDDR